MSSLELQQIEQSIQTNRKFVDLGSSLDRLLGNKDFKRIILEGYFEQEAIRLVHAKADPNMQSVESQRSIVLQMDAIGSLKQYFQLISINASMAAKTIESDEQARDEIQAEELNNG